MLPLWGSDSLPVVDAAVCCPDSLSKTEKIHCPRYREMVALTFSWVLERSMRTSFFFSFENLFIQDHSFLLGQLMSNELLMPGDKGYKVPVPGPQHERLLKGQPRSRALCCKCITVWFFPLLSPTSLIPQQGLILTALSNKPLTGKFLSLKACSPGNLANHTSKSWSS